MAEQPKVAYLASEYPGISHTFIFREIQSLRELGFEVRTASIRQPAHLEKMTAVEKEEAARTLYVLDSSFFSIIMAHLTLLIRSLPGYFRMLALALRLARRGPRNIWKGLAYFAEAGILLSWMHMHRIEHIHVHFANPSATVAMIGAGYGSTTFSVSVHGPDIFYNVDTQLLAEKIRRASRVRCISHYCQSQLMRLVPHELWSKFQIVRCGIDPRVYLPREEPGNEIPEIVCVGRLVPAKGQHILLEACGLLQDRGIRFHLTFVGDGDDRPSLEKLTEEMGLGQWVTFTGAVGQDEVHGYYDRADIFVLASFAEGVPVVLMEAMAKEMAAVTTRITGHAELIDDGVDGMMVSASDVEGLAQCLQTLVQDRELRVRLGKAGRQKVIDRYNLDENCKMMADFFHRHDRRW